jgi:hypothetical protein
MKKLKIPITHSYIKALVQWLSDTIRALSTGNSSYEIKTCCLILTKWLRSERIIELCSYPFTESKSITIKNEVASSLAALMEWHAPGELSDYLGNYLQTIYASIDKHFKQFGT